MTPQVVTFGEETGTRLLAALREHAPDLRFAGFVDRDLRQLTRLGLPLLTLPPHEEIDETIRLDLQLRPVTIQDLYRRPWPVLSPDPVPPFLRESVVMITGAGGSVGSQLCRSIARYAPAAIVAFDISEAGLFELDREMRRRFPAVPFHAEIGSIQNSSRVTQLLRKYKPNILYHAAAYKHVPMLQDQLMEAVRNNVLATWELACQAMINEVERFILVSTDKAVRARNVLGLTKRSAEAAVESIAQTGFRYFAVRLGNVLGSSGSVSRIFQSQIEQRLPITLTDPRMTRYFTTLAEASRFIIDASAMGTEGRIYALEMGDPVPIDTVARQMIALCGLTPDSDIPILITGRRAGEELTEDLFQAGEVPVACGHPRINCVDRSSDAIPLERMRSVMHSLRKYCDDGYADQAAARRDILRQLANCLYGN